MIRIELSTEQADALRELLEFRLRELQKEIRHSDHAEFKARLKRLEVSLDQIHQQLGSGQTPENAPS